MLGKHASDGQMNDVTALGHMILVLATRSVSDALLMQQSAAENVIFKLCEARSHDHIFRHPRGLFALDMPTRCVQDQ